MQNNNQDALSAISYGRIAAGNKPTPPPAVNTVKAVFNLHIKEFI
jgi:hypothetical protein